MTNTTQLDYIVEYDLDLNSRRTATLRMMHGLDLEYFFQSMYFKNLFKY